MFVMMMLLIVTGLSHGHADIHCYFPVKFKAHGNMITSSQRLMIIHQHQMIAPR